MTESQGWSKSIIAIMLMLMFLAYPWCGIEPIDADEIINIEYAVDNQKSSWEAEWIAAEPPELSSPFGGGFSLTMKRLSSQYQVLDLSLIHI